MYLGASIRIIPCSGGQYACFDTPHACLRQSFNISNFQKNKERVWPFWYVCQSGVVQSMFSELGRQYASFGTHKPSVEQF